MLAERALVLQPALFQHPGRCKVELIAFTEHPVQGEITEAEPEQCVEHLQCKPVPPVCRQEGTANLARTGLLLDPFQEDKPGKVPALTVPGPRM
jgi:hypothetical protein